MMVIMTRATTRTMAFATRQTFFAALLIFDQRPIAASIKFFIQLVPYTNKFYSLNKIFKNLNNVQFL
jgi:hypothetical protein